jgi:adenylate cyclase
MNRNDAFAWLVLAEISGLSGKPEAQLQCAQMGMRVDPRHPEIYATEEGFAYVNRGRYTDAIDRLKRGMQYSPWTHAELAFAYSELGQEQEARAEAAEVFRVSPSFSIQQMKQRIPANWQDPPHQHFLAVLSKTGLK